jgi:hypothetical protein
LDIRLLLVFSIVSEMNKLLLILSLMLILTINLFAQDPMIQQTVEQLIESAGEEAADQFDMQEVIDDLIRYKQNPLNVNFATEEELSDLHLLSSYQIKNLISYREKTSTIYSIYELASVEGFTPDILSRIEPFISFEQSQMGTVKKHPESDVFLRFSRSFIAPSASEISKFEGSPDRLYLRIRHLSADYSFGYVGEKDPGESFFKPSNKHGFDYNSAFVNCRFGKANNRLFAGDYNVRFGQGLVAWQGFSMGKSAESTQIFRADPGIRSYSSTDENQFFRGIGSQINTGRFIFSPFVSITRVDAHVDTINGTTYFGAFQTSGYHRTNSEIEGENAVGQITAGGHVSYKFRQWLLGFTGIFNRFDTEMNRDDTPNNHFLPEGKNNFVGGFDWKGSFRQVYFFGELAGSAHSGKAILSGLMVKPTPTAELSLVYRNVNQSYFSYFANAFTESSRINDEQSLYIGAKLFPFEHWTIVGYIDMFENKWLKYTTAAPSVGTELFTQISFNPAKRTSYYLRYFMEDKDQKVRSGNLIYNEKQIINRLRFNFAHLMNEQFSLKSRIEFSFYSREVKEKGFLVFQDVLYKPQQQYFAINGRIAYFNTDGYESRLYAYENDVLYSFSIPPFYGHGFRTYLNLQLRFLANLSFWLKFAVTHQLAQGVDVTRQNSTTKSEIKLQLRYQF